MTTSTRATATPCAAQRAPRAQRALRDLWAQRAQSAPKVIEVKLGPLALWAHKDSLVPKAIAGQ